MKSKILFFVLCCALVLGGQQTSYNVSSTALPPVYVKGVTGAISGVLVVGTPVTATATVTGVATGQPCYAAPSDGTSIASLGVSISINCSVTSTGTATVVVNAIAAGTLTSKTYNVVAFP